MKEIKPGIKEKLKTDGVLVLMMLLGIYLGSSTYPVLTIILSIFSITFIITFIHELRKKGK